MGIDTFNKQLEKKTNENKITVMSRSAKTLNAMPQQLKFAFQHFRKAHGSDRIGSDRWTADAGRLFHEMDLKDNEP